MNKISPATLDLELATYIGNNKSIHNTDIINALTELKTRRALDDQIKIELDCCSGDIHLKQAYDEIYVGDSNGI